MTFNTKRKNVKYYRIGYTSGLLGITLATTWFVYKFLEERY